MKRRDFLVASATLAGSIVPRIGSAQTKPCPPPSIAVAGGQSATTSCNPASAQADWQSRISGPGVVWYHDFQSDAEVNAFRWTAGYGSGNDPLAVGNSRSGDLRRITTDGITGACMELIRRPVSDTATTSVWWRPMSPIVGSGNGRGVDDPGAGGKLTPQAYAATDGGGQIAGWGKGFYTNSIYQSLNPSKYDGNEYWFQMRFKMDPARTATAGNRSQSSSTGGKMLYLTRCDRSLTSQEVNTIQYISGSGVANTVNFFDMYRSGSPPLWDDPPGVAVAGNQPGTQFGTHGDKLCYLSNQNGDIVNCWSYPAGQWVTLMYHVKPGTMSPAGTAGLVTNGGTANADTTIEVYAALPGATSFTRIWSQTQVPLPFDVWFGHQAVHLTNWLENGGSGIDTQFYQRWCQLIFSQQAIPCPQV